MKKVEQNSGIMKFDPSTKQVRADMRKGKIVFEVNEDNEKRFQWIEQDQKEPEVDLYLFKNDAEFTRVNGIQSSSLIRQGLHAQFPEFPRKVLLLVPNTGRFEGRRVRLLS